MRGRRGLMLAGVVVAVGVWLGAGGVALGDDSVTPLCNGQACKAPPNAWYTSPVAVTWAVSTTPPPDQTVGCGGMQPSPRDTVATTSCEAIWNGVDDIKRSYTVHVEMSSPTASAAVTRAPDSNGWYNHPVGVVFGGSAFSGIASCTSTTYAGPDIPSTTVSGSCTDNAGKVASASIQLHYDATPPTITRAKPRRPPDHHGWYNHPVRFAFSGTDALSGISSCATMRYAGPNSAGASVTGSCTDRAGNVATLAVPLRYDFKPPPVKARATTGDGFVSLHWLSGGDVAPIKSLRIRRSPGVNRPHSVVYRGHGNRLYDGRVTNGRRYTYKIRAVDQAGNVTERTIHITAGPHIISPALGAHSALPPLLVWTRVRHADYYNVQLYRGKTKVLSAWPKGRRLQLKATWRFARHRYRLKPGRYRWYVWPGFGPRAVGHYGKLIGAGTFVVVPAT